MSLISFVRILFSSIIIFLIAHLLNFKGMQMILIFTGLIVFYFGFLCFIKEIKENDKKIVKDIFNKIN